MNIMLTMRPLEMDGKWGQKSHKVNGRKVPTVDWNEPTKAEEWRADWSNSVNAFLEHGNHADRVDHRSFKRQGKDELPTVHMGVAACQMEKKGIKTERGNYNRNVENINSELRQLKARINKLNNWIKEETAKPENDKPLTLTGIIENIFSQQAKTGKSQHYQSIANIKNAAKMVNFLTTNNITDMASLEEKINVMISRRADIQNKLKPVERRLKTLDKHIEQADYYFQFKGIYNKYSEIKKPKKQEKFREEHRQEITLFETAKEYIDGVMNGKRPIPRKTWRAEREKLTAEKDTLYRQYYVLKDDVKEIEQIKKSVYEIMRTQTVREQPQKKRGNEIE